MPATRLPSPLPSIWQDEYLLRRCRTAQANPLRRIQSAWDAALDYLTLGSLGAILWVVLDLHNH